MPGPSTFKARITYSAAMTASAAMIAMALSGCSLTATKPEIAATASSGPRPASAAEAMQSAIVAKQQRQTENSATAYVDPLVSARPGEGQNQRQNPRQNGQAQNVSDFRASGRSAAAAMRAETMPSSGTAQAARAATASAVPQLTETDLAGVVAQPTGIQAGRNSIFSAASAPAADIASAGAPISAPHVSSASGSLSTDAVAYAPVRRISGTTGGLFAGGPQMASSANTGSTSAPAAANHAPPGIATRPTVPAAAEPLAQGLW